MTPTFNDALALVAEKALPVLSGSKLTYNAEKNVYLTLGYTSAAGNTYFKAIRLSNRIGVYYDIGIGYCRTFLNGITLFAWDGDKAIIIARKNWGGYCNYRFFSEENAKMESINMLQNFLAGQMKMLGKWVDERQLHNFASQMIEETRQKQLALY